MIAIEWPLLLIQVVTFLAAMAVVWKFFWGPLTALMKDRSRKIAEDIQRAESGRKEIDALEAEYQRRLAEIEEQARKQIQEAVRRGTSAKEEILQEARREAQRLMQKARQDLDQEREQVIRDIRGQVAELTLAAVERILGPQPDPSAQKRLVEDFLRDLDSMKVAR